MATIHLRRGQIIVDDPPASLADQLKFFRRGVGREDGRYEALAQFQDRRLVTFPGFAHRIIGLCSGARVVDERVPLPTPDLVEACRGLRDYQLEPAVAMIRSGGGIASLPTGFGKTHLIAAIIKAFSHEEMLARGTPLVVVAAAEKDLQAQLYTKLKELLPGREVGRVTSASSEMSDDIIVTGYKQLEELDANSVGILIADEVHTSASTQRSAAISRLHNAARWGVSATPTGRFDGGDIVTEGLFGPVVTRFTYADMVRVGALVPIEVYWLKAPRPKYLSHGGYQGMVASATRDNPAMCRLVADIMGKIPEDKKAICFVDHVRFMAKILDVCPDIPFVHGDASGQPPVSAKLRKERKAAFAEGKITKILSTGIWRQGIDFPELDVVVSTSCGSGEIAATQIPGRASRKAEGKDRAYLVDFQHSWDFRNGKPGMLWLNDKSRQKCYRELGFKQVFVDSVSELPFVNA